MFQHTAARRQLELGISFATARAWFQHTAARRQLGHRRWHRQRKSRFNTQPPEGSWNRLTLTARGRIGVSTHSRPKAAGRPREHPKTIHAVSTHSRPKAAVGGRCRQTRRARVSTHSRPKAAELLGYTMTTETKFQHTAARRQLFCLSSFRPWQGCFNTQPPEGS